MNSRRLTVTVAVPHQKPKSEKDLVPSLASKLGYISFGIIVGCISSRGLLRRGPSTDNNNAKPSSASSLPLSNHQDNFLINGKSFLDSLPFEEVIPLFWNPAQRRPHEEELLHISSSKSPLSTVKRGEMNLLAASLLGSKDAPVSSPGPHLLYHAHESSFSLLYDSSKLSNSYLSEYSLDYFLLNSGGFDAQINQAYCSVATVAAVLNSLKYAKRFREEGDLSGWSFDLPVDPRYAPYPYATQKDILAGDCVWNTVVEHGDGSIGEHGGHVDGIFKPPYGLSMEQSAKLLKCHTSNEWDVKVQEVDPSQLTLSKMRYDLKASLIDPDARIMINYDRKVLGQVGGGHFSPLVAYHSPTDSFLIMDVAKYKYPPVWVGADTLFAAMATVDKCGTYDYPKGQERLDDNTSDGTTNKLINPITHEEYLRSLELLNCKQKMRGYIILKKNG
eukprot:CAMPEP_0172539618 /NCGR_PEP_ID=MMETSP1067-20121228/10788_1 /TAXON_ID=265564 ORGANISM="Thalassiosira punctigera, Strain Tpunct2005C2" /NCGR_SAMPLE_ID=MMETSP1067 /ASSEMBLY_ACC=CAM_ASM_000444 /LENGTH=445 /DNA_ID=CAMNT_0013325337 /DNA_START=116 /DNA_END=1452 /DNA_ORIENTATION=-